MNNSVKEVQMLKNERKTILLVEDEALVALSEESTLQDGGFDVITVNSGEKAVEAAGKNTSIDLVLMDIDLGKGKMDGTEAAEQILKLRNLPIVFCTGHGEKTMVDRVRGITRYGYVLKSSGEFVLLEAVLMAFELFEAHEYTKKENAYRKEAEQEKERQLQHIRFLADTALSFIDLQNEEAVYTYITRCLKELLPDTYITVNSVDMQKGILRTEAVEGLGGLSDTIISMLGLNPVGKIYALDETITDLHTGKLEKFPHGLYELTFGGLPRSICASIEKFLQIKHIYGIGFMVDKQLYATAVFFFPKGRELQNAEIVEAFVHQASIALKRQKIEKDLWESRRRLRLFVDSNTDFCFLKDKDLRYTMCNAANARFFGKEIDAVLGKTDQELMPAVAARECAKTDRSAMESGAITVSVEEVGERIFETRKMPVVEDGQIIGVAGNIRDITERKRAEEMVRKLLQEKELLLKETRHRVKNHMYTIYNYLSIQAFMMNDSAGKNVLEDAANRAQFMIVLYDRLYSYENQQLLNVKEFLPSLIEEMIRLYPGDLEVQTKIRVEEMYLSYKIVSPLGIILNELITNSMKHAFHGRANGLIHVDMRVKDDLVVMIYGDNGVGLKTEEVLEDSGRLGIRLMGLLVQQLEGSMNIEKQDGTKFIIEFPLEARSKTEDPSVQKE